MIDLFRSPIARSRRRHADLLAQFDPLLRLADEAGALARRDEAVSTWSVGQQLEHIAKVDAAIFERIEGLLADPSVDKGSAIPPARVMLLVGRIPRGRGKAPEQTLPTGIDAAEVRSMLEASELNWQRFEPRLEELAASRSKTPHPVLGAFTAAQWLRFEQVHVRHHRRIIEDILASS